MTDEQARRMESAIRSVAFAVTWGAVLIASCIGMK